MRFLCVIDLFLRNHPGAIQSLAAIVAINALSLIFVATFCTNQFSRRGRCGHGVDSFFGLAEGVDGKVFDVFASWPADFSPLALAGEGASFLAAS
jgi:hypothetical protein